MAFQLPKICCRCGERLGVKMRQINTSHVTGFEHYVVAFSVKRTLYSFSVPVCDDCFDELEQSDKVVKAIRILVSLLVTGWFLYIFISLGYIVSGVILSIAIYFIFYLALIRRPISGRKLGDFSGEYFWFSNKEFFKQFAELNPQLIAPYRFHPVAEQPVIEESRPRFSLPDRKILLPVIVLILAGFGICAFWIGFIYYATKLH
jgi:hypothetical protein